MPHKKTSVPRDSITRLRDLLTELKVARSGSDEFTQQARREIRAAIRGAELQPVGTSGTLPRRKRRAKKR
jgi:hypothetical protein